MNTERIFLKELLTVDHIMIGVKAFFTISCTGGSNKVSQRKSTLINSSAADAVNLTSGGKIFRGKHISLVL